MTDQQEREKRKSFYWRHLTAIKVFAVIAFIIVFAVVMWIIQLALQSGQTSNL